jgi:hypothetical protein
MAALAGLVLAVVLTRGSQSTPVETVPVRNFEVQVAITLGKQLGEPLKVRCYPGSKVGYKRGYACAVTEPSKKCTVWLAAPTNRAPVVAPFPSRSCASLAAPAQLG